MAGPLKKYRFINAKLRARLSKILSGDYINKMLHSPSLPEAIQLLAATDYAVIEGIYNKTGDLKMAELELFKTEVKLYIELEKHMSDDVLRITRALATKFETENLKNIIRLWFDRQIRGRDIESAAVYLYREKIHYDLHIDAVIHAESMSAVVDALAGTPYQQILREKILTVEKRKSIFEIEIAIDHYYYRQLLQAVAGLSKRDFQIASRLIGVAIDMQNINWIVRFKMTYELSLNDAMQFCIPAGYNLKQEVISQAYSSENITELLSGLIRKKYPGLQTLLSQQTQDTYARLLLVERILNQIVSLEINRVLVGYPFTIGIVLAYFILKANEIKTIMTILNAKYYGIGEERIRSGI